MVGDFQRLRWPVRNSRDSELSELDAIEQARSQVFVLNTDELVEVIPVIWAAL